MYEKILQKLIEQHTAYSASLAKKGTVTKVEVRTLTDIAKTLSAVITTDEQLTALDATAAITSIEGNMSHHIAKEVALVREKHVPATPATPAAPAAPATPPATETPVEKQLRELLEINKQNALAIAALQNDKTVGSRSSKLQEVLKDLPEYYTAPITAQLPNLQFQDEAGFDAFVVQVKAQADNFKQHVKEAGLPMSVPANAHVPTATPGISTATEKARAIIAAAKAEEAKAQKPV